MWDSIVAEEQGTCIATDSELDSLEAKFKIALPLDYKAFLKKFGEGVLYNHVRVFGPKKIVNEVSAFRDRWEGAFLWDGDGSALTAEEIGDCVIIGDTFNGDEFVLSPLHPSTIFYLPQDADKIVDLGQSLENAIRKLIERIQAQLVDDPDRGEWDLRPVFNCENF